MINTSSTIIIVDMDIPVLMLSYPSGLLQRRINVNENFIVNAVLDANERLDLIQLSS